MICKLIEGYSNYVIYENGMVFNLNTCKFLKSNLAKNGYYTFDLWKNNKGVKFYLHRLLAIHFIENTNSDYTVVNHIDGCKTNNKLYNLEWCSYSINNKHAYDCGLKKVSENVRDSMRKTQSKYKSKNKGCSKNVCVELNSGKVMNFNSMKDCSEYFNIHHSTLYRMNKRNSFGRTNIKTIIIK